MIGRHFLQKIKKKNLQKKFIFGKIAVGKKQPTTGIPEKWDPKVGPAFMGTQQKPLSIHLQAPFSRKSLTPDPANDNMVMSQTRVSKEWLFNEIKTYFKFVLLKS